MVLNLGIWFCDVVMSALSHMMTDVMPDDFDVFMTVVHTGSFSDIIPNRISPP